MKKWTVCAVVVALFLISATKAPHKKFLKKTQFVFVPAGSHSVSDNAVSVNAFLMLNHEVTNFEYTEFIKANYLSKGDTIGALDALPDSSAWIDSTNFKGFMDPLVTMYHKHPAYYNYPVVNVSKENAEKYCVWLTEVMRKKFPTSTFNDFRLPTKTEWMYAAKGGLKDASYPWGGAFTQNSKGCYLANFNPVGLHNITADEYGKPKIVSEENFKANLMADGHFGPAKAKTYTANNYGLYNMSGNVAEMVADENKVMGGHWLSYGNDIQVTSEIEFKKANPMVGFRPIVSF